MDRGVSPPDSSVPFQLDGVIMLGTDGGEPLHVEGVTLTFGHDGIGVIHGRGDHPRLLPWPLLTAHAAEGWSGLITPPWWVDPELNRADDGSDVGGEIIGADSTARSLPRTAAGALLSFRTPLGVHRFLVPGGDPDRLTSQVAAFTRDHQGGTGSSTAVTFFAGRPSEAGGRGSASGRTGRKSGRKGLTWARIRPVLTVILIVCLATIAVLIVLQSAGTVHLPILGGASP
ncbi:MAG: hypothetical protein ACYCV7_17750 [Acidimicrobiales bacterium]